MLIKDSESVFIRIKKDRILMVSYVLSYLVFLRLSFWGGGFNSIDSLDVVTVSKITIRLITFSIAFIYLIKYVKFIGRYIRAPYIQFVYFLLFSSFSLLYTSDFFYSTFRLVEHVGYLVFSLVIVVNVSRNSSDTEEVIRKCVNLILYSLVILITIVWCASFLVPEYVYRHIVGDVKGLGGAVLHIHTLANIASLVFGVSLHRLFCLQSKNSILNYLIPVAMVVTIYMTRSRSGLGMILILTLLVLIYHSKNKFVRYTFPVAIAFIIVVVSSKYETIVQYILRGQQLDDLLRLTERVRFWSYLVSDTFNESPLLGYGYQMLSTNGIIKYFPDMGYSISNAHNSFIQTFVGLGLIGLALLLYQILRTVYSLYLAEKKSRSSLRDRGFEVAILVLACLLASFTQYGIVGMTTPVVPVYMMAVTLIAYHRQKLYSAVDSRSSLR